jgi:hypothetical protein
MRTFLVVDRESLDEASAEAGPKDKIVIAEGAFEKPPRLVLDGSRWIVADTAWRSTTGT